MAILNISEFAENNPITLQAARYPKLASQDVAIGATSAQSDAFSATTVLVRVVADVACYIDIATDPTAAAEDTYLPANAPEYFRVAGFDKLAVIEA